MARITHSLTQSPKNPKLSLSLSSIIRELPLNPSPSQNHKSTSKRRRFPSSTLLSSNSSSALSPTNFRFPISLWKLLGFSLLFALQIWGKSFGTKLAMDYEPYDSSGKHFSLLNFQFFCSFWVIWVFWYVGMFCFLREIRVWGFFCLNFLRQCSWWGGFWVSWSEGNLGF